MRMNEGRYFSHCLISTEVFSFITLRFTFPRNLPAGKVGFLCLYVTFYKGARFKLRQRKLFVFFFATFSCHIACQGFWCRILASIIFINELYLLFMMSVFPAMIVMHRLISLQRQEINEWIFQFNLKKSVKLWACMSV